MTEIWRKCEFRTMRVFFYGLFMDVAILAQKGIQSRDAVSGYLSGYSLTIGERATLLPADDGQAYGLVMEVDSRDVNALYSEDSVADYLPEPVTVVLTNGAKVEAICYNLPREKVTGTNKAYAASLLKLATRIGFPAPYIDEIRRSTK